MPHGPADHLPGEQVDDGAPVPARMCAMTAHWPTPGVRIEHTADSNRCKPDLQHGSLFSSRSSNRHILPPRRVLRRAPLLLHSPILALVRPPPVAPECTVPLP